MQHRSLPAELFNHTPQEQQSKEGNTSNDAGADALSLLNLFEIAIHHRKIAPVSLDLVGDY